MTYILKNSPVLLPRYEHVIKLLIHPRICSPWIHDCVQVTTQRDRVCIHFHCCFQNPYLAWVCFLDILLFDHSFFSSISRSFAWIKKKFRNEWTLDGIFEHFNHSHAINLTEYACRFDVNTCNKIFYKHLIDNCHIKNSENNNQNWNLINILPTECATLYLYKL